MSKISVAMAVYNGEKYIVSQIESILCQLNDNDELIISYDKSKDKTLDIIKEYERKDKRIRVFINNTPGVFGNFNNAIKQTNGDIIFISDQDDIWKHNKIKKIVSLINVNNFDFIIHNGVHIDTNDNIISEDFFKLYNIKRGVLRNFIKPRYSGCCMAFKKKYKKLILPIPTNVGAYDHWLGMIGEIYGKVYFLDEILIHHRIHGKNVTPTSRRKIPDIFKYRTILLYKLLGLKRRT